MAHGRDTNVTIFTPTTATEHFPRLPAPSGLILLRTAVLLRWPISITTDGWKYFLRTAVIRNCASCTTKWKTSADPLLSGCAAARATATRLGRRSLWIAENYAKRNLWWRARDFFRKTPKTCISDWEIGASR